MEVYHKLHVEKGLPVLEHPGVLLNVIFYGPQCSQHCSKAAVSNQMGICSTVTDFANNVFCFSGIKFDLCCPGV